MLDYKLYRKSLIFKYVNYTAYVVAFDSIVELNEVATLVWKMADGINKVGDIINQINYIFPTVDKTIIIQDIKELLIDLSNREVLELNWNPLYKNLLPNEI